MDQEIYELLQNIIRIEEYNKVFYENRYKHLPKMKLKILAGEDLNGKNRNENL